MSLFVVVEERMNKYRDTRKYKIIHSIRYMFFEILVYNNKHTNKLNILYDFDWI